MMPSNPTNASSQPAPAGLNLGPIMGLIKKRKTNLCMWEQMFGGFDEPVGSCLDTATHQLLHADGRSFGRDFHACLYHGRLWSNGVYTLAPLGAEAVNLLTWDNSLMGLRVETRIEGVLIQTFISGARRRSSTITTGTMVRAGLRVVA